MISFTHTRFKSIVSIVALLAFLQSIVVPGVLYAQEPAIDAKTYEKLKKELKEELYAEIRTELYEEFNAQIHQLVADNIRRELKEQLAGQIAESREELQAYLSDDRPPLMPGERLEYVVQKTVAEVFRSGQWDQYISDEELDRIVAGNDEIKPELGIQGGYNKTPQVTPSLLARGKGKASRMTKNDYDLAAGEMRQESIERTLQSKGSILLGKGKLQVEPSFTWAHFSSNRINIQGFSILPVLVIGNIEVVETRRDVFITSFAMKYGLLNNLQAEVKVPFRGQYNRDTFSDHETTLNSAGMGDIEFGLSRQMAWESGIVPDLIAAVNFKSKTGRSPYNRTIGLGTGHYSVRGSLVAAKSSDPAVVFGSLSYTYNFEEDIQNFGLSQTLEPGSTIGYSLGMAIALSYQTAINFSFDHSLTQQLKVNGNKVDGSFLNSANVKIGANWSINEKSSVDFSVAFGVTDDAPDVTAEVRFPFVF